MTGVVPERERAADSLTLKPISKAAIPRALEKAERYRLLDDPEQAESICLDILAADADNQPALVALILSVTDQFRSHRARGVLAREYVGRLTDAYQRSYYEGLVWEREARARLRQPRGSEFAYHSFRSAMACYERADALSSADDDDAILRWNACLRTIERAKLGPHRHEMEQPLE
jgi:hypothetical protein